MIIAGKYRRDSRTISINTKKIIAEMITTGVIPTIYRQSSQPTTAFTEDLWYNTTTYLLYRYSGTVWELVGNSYNNTNQLTDGANLGGTATWSGVSSKPTELTDGRVSAGLDSSGNPKDPTTGNTIITGGYIRTSFLTADNIQTGTLTGRFIRTASSGKRIEINNSDTWEVQWYDSSNNIIASIGDENVATDWRFFNLDFAPSNSSSGYVGNYIGLSGSNRTTSGRSTIGTYTEVYSVQNNTLGVGGYFRAYGGVSAETHGIQPEGDTSDIYVGGVTYLKARENGIISLKKPGTTPYRLVLSGVAGSITAGTSPSVKRGKGFSVSYVSTGIYDVTFSNAFAANPIAIAQVEDSSGNIPIDVYNIATTGFRVRMNVGGTNYDKDFNFIAIIPATIDE